MDAATRQLVRDRANHRCEYCRLPQEAAPFFTFHIEHIRARKHGGRDEPQNLALACPDCNRFKGTDLRTVDPDTDQETAIFSPRIHSWDDHFKCDAMGLT
jgi:5-methylcytosine-specific restriction endonuclease McrA